MPPEKRTKWTAEEDRLLRKAVEQHGDKDRWQEVADAVRTRDNKSCRKVNVIVGFIWWHSNLTSDS